MSDKVDSQSLAAPAIGRQVTLAKLRELVAQGNLREVTVYETEGNFTIQLHMDGSAGEPCAGSLVTSNTGRVRVFKKARTYAKMLNETGIKKWKLQKRHTQK